jgi:N-acetylglutamate synthase-like GNAT family acetyltransferase
VGITIRQARHEDTPHLERLIAASVRTLGAAYYTEEEIERALVHVFGVDTQLIEDGTYFVAEADGQIVGCGGWSRRKTLFGSDRAKGAAEDSLLDPKHAAARIRAFFVHPDWARRGIGARLLRVCEAAARESGFDRAELAATLPGEPLYTAAGYVEMQQIDVDLRDGFILKIVHMGKDLAPHKGEQKCTDT